MGYRIITFSTNDKEILRILRRASRYNLRSALINRALKSVDLEKLLEELLREPLMEDEEEVIKEQPKRTQKPTEDTTKPKKTEGVEIRKPTLLEEFGELL